MPIRVSIILFMLFCAVDGTAQITDSIVHDSLPKLKPDIHGEVHKSRLGLCHITTDLITFEQFRTCTEVTIEGADDIEITSFDLLYFIPRENSVSVEFIRGNIIPSKIVEKIISEGSNKILIENVLIKSHVKIKKIKSRYFYLK